MATSQYSPLSALWSPIISGNGVVTGTVIGVSSGGSDGTSGFNNFGINGGGSNGGGSNGFNNGSNGFNGTGNGNGNTGFNTLNSRDNNGGNNSYTGNIGNNSFGSKGGGCNGNNSFSNNGNTNAFNGNNGYVNTGNGGGGQYNGNCNGSNTAMGNPTVSSNTSNAMPSNDYGTPNLSPRYNNDSSTNNLFSRQQMIPMIFVPASALPCGGATNTIDTAGQVMAAKEVRPALSENVSSISSSVSSYNQPETTTVSQSQAEEQPAATTTTKVPLLTSIRSRIGRLWSR